MHGTPPSYIGRRPEVAHVKRKRSEIDDAEIGEVQMKRKRSQTNAMFIQEIKTERIEPTHIQSSSSK